MKSLKDVFSAKQKDRLLKKMVEESREVGDTTENRTILYRYSTDDEIEIAILSILEADGLVVYKSRHGGSCHYQITKFALGFEKNGGYKRIQSRDRDKKINKLIWTIISYSITFVIGIILGKILG